MLKLQTTSIHNARPKFVVVYHLEPNGSRSALEMHIADAERVVREFPNEWSRFPNAMAIEVASADQPTPLERLGKVRLE